MIKELVEEMNKIESVQKQANYTDTRLSIAEADIKTIDKELKDKTKSITSDLSDLEDEFIDFEKKIDVLNISIIKNKVKNEKDVLKVVNKLDKNKDIIDKWMAKIVEKIAKIEEKIKDDGEENKAKIRKVVEGMVDSMSNKILEIRESIKGIDVEAIAKKVEELEERFRNFNPQVYVQGLWSGVTKFTQLWDAPTSYVGQAGKAVVVNANEDGVEFWTVAWGWQASIEFQDEWTGLWTSGTVTEVDFTGAGVTASRVWNKVTVDIPWWGWTRWSITWTLSDQTDLQTALDWKVSKITSTDNAVARYDGITGVLQDSLVTISDTGEITTPSNVITTALYTSAHNWVAVEWSNAGQGKAFVYAIGNDANIALELSWFGTGWVKVTDNFNVTGSATIDTMLLAPTRRATTSAGVLIEAANGTDVWLLWAWNTANVTWYGSHNFDTATQDTIAIFTGSWKTLWSAATATYPNLTELSYVKWVTSSIQTQLNALANGMFYKWAWDASSWTFPWAGAAQVGWFYSVTVWGTVDSVVFNVWDKLIATTNNASTTIYAWNWIKLDATDEVTSVNSQVWNVVLDADDIDDTSTAHKFVTSTDLTKLSNLSGINTGDQDLSWYALKSWTTFTWDVALTWADVSLAINTDSTTKQAINIATSKFGISSKFDINWWYAAYFQSDGTATASPSNWVVRIRQATAWGSWSALIVDNLGTSKTIDVLQSGTSVFSVNPAWSLEIWHASDTTLSRVSAWVLAIEGVNIVTETATQALTNKSVNWVTLTTGWSSTTYLSADGTYTTPAWWGGWGWGSYKRAIAWTIWATGTNVANTILVNSSITFTSCNLWYWTAGNGTLTVDINKNWTTMFSSVKPSITSTNQTSVNTWTLTTTTAVQGDLLTIDVDAVPWTKGVDLYVELFYS